MVEIEVEMDELDELVEVIEEESIGFRFLICSLLTLKDGLMMLCYAML